MVRILAEYIDREALLEELKERHDYVMQDPEVGKTMKWCEAVCYGRTKDIMDTIPAADVVEVPCHCKDCRYNDPSWQLSADSIGCRYWGIYPDPDDWCCKAERKVGE